MFPSARAIADAATSEFERSWRSFAIASAAGAAGSNPAAIKVASSGAGTRLDYATLRSMSKGLTGRSYYRRRVGRLGALIAVSGLAALSSVHGLADLTSFAR